MNTIWETEIKKECKELLKIYNLKGYRRHSNFLKILHNSVWQRECSITEFAWNYCRSPQNATKIVSYLQSTLIDDAAVTKWFVKANQSIDPAVCFMSLEDANKHLKENSELTHVHFIHQSMEQAVDQPETGISSIEYEKGDLFHGVLLDDATLNSINNIQFIFEFPDNETNDIETHYIYHQSDIRKMRYILNVDEKTTTNDCEDLYYVVPLFKHPIPLVHLEDNNVKLYVRVMPIVIDDCLTSGNPANIEVFPIYSILNKQHGQWFEDRNLRIILRDTDKLSIGENKIKIIEV